MFASLTPAHFLKRLFVQSEAESGKFGEVSTFLHLAVTCAGLRRLSVVACHIKCKRVELVHVNLIIALQKIHTFHTSNISSIHA